MAIIIPSKNIYEINNQKVVANEVDNIEVTAKNVIPDNHYNESVYNKRIPVTPIAGTAFQDYSTDGYIVATALDDIKDKKIYHAVAGLTVSTRYSEVVVNIPIYKDDTHIIDSVFYGKDKNGKNNIGVSIIGKIKQGSANGGYLDYTAAKYSEGNTFDKSRYKIHLQGIQFGEPEKEESKTYEFTTEALNDDITEPQNVLSPSQESDVNENGAIYVYNAVPSNITPAPLDPTGAVAKELHTSIIHKIEDLGNVATQKITKTTDGYSVRLRILSGIAIQRYDSIFDSFDYSIAFGEYQGNASKTNVPLTGRYVEYAPTDVEITILGNTIGISLQDETVKIGDGQHVYSFSGNELMQTSNKIFIDNYGITLVRFINYRNTADYLFTHDEKNDDLSVGDVIYYEDETATVRQTSNGEKYLETIPSGKIANTNYQPFQARVAKAQIQKNCNDIIRQWENGKEIAQIKCAMDNYYLSENRYEPYSTIVLTYLCSTGENANPAFYNKYEVKVGDKLQFDEGATLIVLSREEIEHMGNIYTALICDWEDENKKISLIVNRTYYPMILRATNIAVSLSEGAPKPMTIQIGERVIPYVKKADGKDAPMSYYFDKATPKEFLVIGNGIIADGEIMQNLTLQEIPLDKKQFIILENHGDLRTGEEFSYIEVYVQQGEISVGDVLEYKGETGEVTEDLGENTYEMAVNTNGAFMNTKIILAKKV